MPILKIRSILTALLCLQVCLSGFAKIELMENYKISFVGSGMGSRMVHYGHFETEIFLRYPNHNLTIRNLCDEGNTPGFRPHPSREQEGQYAFPGARELIHKNLQADTKPKGHFPTPDQWLSDLKTDVILCFFGFNSSFDGPKQLNRFKKELDAFLKHTKDSVYGSSSPKVALISPTAVQAISGVTNGKYQNRNLKLYMNGMKEVALKNKILFVDAYTPSLKWYKEGKPLSIDGALFNNDTVTKTANFSDAQLFKSISHKEKPKQELHQAVMDKNFYWLNDFKVPNGVHVYGRRYNPYGPQNYPFEIEKTREYTRIRDEAIWALLNEKPYDIKSAEAKSSKLPDVPTNYFPRQKTAKMEILNTHPDR
jgi:hypothetical protein